MDNINTILESLEQELIEIITEKVEKIVKLSSVEKNPIFYHYTNLECLQKIIENKSFYFSNSFFLNDKLEFKKGLEIFEQKINSFSDNNLINDYGLLQKIKDKFKLSNSSNRYVACFSLKGDLLSHWRAYSNDGKGVCIAFNGNKLINFFDSTKGFPIIYDKIKQEQIADIVIYQAFNFYLQNKEKFLSSLSESEFAEKISEKMFFQIQEYIGIFKHTAFQEEKEFRFEIKIDENNTERELKFRNGVNNLFVPYVIEFNSEYSTNLNDILFPIKELIIGPSLNSELNIISTTKFLEKNGYDIDKILIKASEVPYRI